MNAQWAGMATELAFSGYVCICCPPHSEARDAAPTVVFNVGHYSHDTSGAFLSVALDTALIRSGWLWDHIESEQLVQLTSLLAPAYLRIGGTLADCLIFTANGTQRRVYDECAEGITYCSPDVRNFSMTGSEWTQIHDFCQRAGVQLLFDLNALLRNGDNWDPTNAKQLLDFSDEHNLSATWQLGNEPNSFKHKFNVTVTGHQLGRDFGTLRALLDSYPSSRASALVGPDVTRPLLDSAPSLSFLADFLDTAGRSISAVTWHHYYVDGRSATLEDFTNSSVFNSLAKQIKAVRATARKKTPDLPLWLTETSSAYGGGAPGLSDVFVAGLLWLDKLGVSARLGVDAVVRQALYGGSYSLLDLHTLRPLPDWWLSVLYKRVVGRGVLRAPLPTGDVRLYCHCGPPGVPHSLAVFGANLGQRSALVQLEGAARPRPASAVLAYVLTGQHGPLSRTVLLNGVPLQLEPDGSPPLLRPAVLPAGVLCLPPLSVAFFIVHGARVPECHHG
ncbi:heparanase-like isoform X1 [Bacillus rossius redtenbacheri]|uniref:heparanase-like isoform X1 n=1 Tax=Bacillus rossius redtenbacheri TaxID=93214 RepID=UPI002FDD216E